MHNLLTIISLEMFYMSVETSLDVWTLPLTLLQ